MLCLLISTVYLVTTCLSADIIPREILFQDAKYSSVSLSPDGKQVGYVAPDENGMKNVFVRCSTCSASRQVTFESHPVLGEYDAPKWRFGSVWFLRNLPLSRLPVDRDSGNHSVRSRQSRGREYAFLQEKYLFGEWLIRDDKNDSKSLPHTRQPMILEFSSYFQAADKSNRFVISDKPGVKAVMMSNNLISETILLGINDENPALHNIYSFDLRTDKLTLVLRNKRFPMFFFDNEMTVRLASEEGPDGEMVYFRPEGSLADAQSTSQLEWKEYLRIQHDDKPITLWVPNQFLISFPFFSGLWPSTSRTTSCSGSWEKAVTSATSSSFHSTIHPRKRSCTRPRRPRSATCWSIRSIRHCWPSLRSITSPSCSSQTTLSWTIFSTWSIWNRLDRWESSVWVLVSYLLSVISYQFNHFFRYVHVARDLCICRWA